VLELRKQIAAAGHVLVKEYVDNGFSGPRFDRPALNEMRKDVKTDAFDVICRLETGAPCSAVYTPRDCAVDARLWRVVNKKVFV
jgi:hypothetical protein